MGHQVHQTRGKTANARRSIDLDATTLAIPSGWRAFQEGVRRGRHTNDEGWVFTDGAGEPVHPHTVYEAFRRIVHNAGVPTSAFMTSGIRTGACSSPTASR